MRNEGRKRGINVDRGEGERKSTRNEGKRYKTCAIRSFASKILVSTEAPLQQNPAYGHAGVSDPRGSHVFGCRSAALGDDPAGSGRSKKKRVMD